MPFLKSGRPTSHRLTTVDQAKSGRLGCHADVHPTAESQGVGCTHDAVFIGAHAVAHTGKPGVYCCACDAGVIGQRQTRHTGVVAATAAV